MKYPFTAFVDIIIINTWLYFAKLTKLNKRFYYVLYFS